MNLRASMGRCQENEVVCQDGVALVSTQNTPKVVEGNLKVIAKTTSKRNWLLFLERDLSHINLTRPDI